MDDDTVDLLKTVCAAGRAHPGYNCNSNERLDDLVNAGLLAVVKVPDDDPRRTVPLRYYRPTEMGKALSRKLSEKDAAA